MAQKLNLQATKREESGTGAAKRLRRQGVTPGVIYGSHQDNYMVQVKTREFADLIHQSSSENILINLQIEGAREKDKLALVQAVQHDPLNGAVVHVDFLAVSEDETISASVPVMLVGEPEGVRMGGLLDHMVHALEVSCRPADLPEKLEVDVSELLIGQAVHVSDLALPEGVEVSADGSAVLASVQEVKVVEEEPEAVAEGEEPEVVGESAEGEEGEESAKDGGDS
ncbi:MAG: 50S ribosomal protein L25 [Verrucomicrobiales bacterium]